jgi:hypothetical protein
MNARAAEVLVDSANDNLCEGPQDHAVCGARSGSMIRGQGWSTNEVSCPRWLALYTDQELVAEPIP